MREHLPAVQTNERPVPVLTEKLKVLIPRQMFKVPIQACIGVKVTEMKGGVIRRSLIQECTVLVGEPRSHASLKNSRQAFRLSGAGMHARGPCPL